jgi:hypothetical protein
MNATVSHRITFTWNGKGQPRTTVRCFWSAHQPHEVILTFRTWRQGCVEWHVGIELLVNGLNGPAGVGDVTIIPSLDDPQAVELILTDSACPLGLGAGFTVAKQALREFLVEIQEAHSASASGAIEL